MKILLASTGYPRWKDDFNHIFLHRLAKSLVDKGHEVHVMAPHAKGLNKDEMVDGVFIHRFQYLYPSYLETLCYLPGIPEKLKTFRGKFQMPFLMLAMAKKTVSLCNRYDIDIVNAHFALPTGLVVALTKIFHHKPILITLYGAELYPVIKNNFKVMGLIINYALNNVNKVVGISDTTCNAGALISGRKDIDVLPDGIDTKTFSPNANGNIFLKNYNLIGYNIIFSSGRMVERKGFRYLIEAFPLILKDFPKTRLIIAGDGPERSNLEKIAVKLGIGEYIIFPGFIANDDFPAHMNACDVFVLPSTIDSKGDTEGSATILLEAMACETPVVTTTVGGIPYAIKDGVGGFLVAPNNPRQLAEKIISIFRDKNSGLNLGKLGRKYVIENFDSDIVAYKYIDSFEKILGIDKNLYEKSK